jgi:hypothetical protein
MSIDVLEVRAASINRALMMQTARTSETSVDIELRTRQYIPEDSERHTRRRENLKYHTLKDSVPWSQFRTEMNSVCQRDVWLVTQDVLTYVSISKVIPFTTT